MPIAPVHKLKKSEIVWLGTHRCRRHKHTYLEHYSCYLKERPDRNRIGFFDIETTNLKANVGFMIGYCIKDENSDKIFEGSVTPREVRNGTLDKKLIKKLLDDLNEFDKIITFYGTGFDLPYIRSRAVHWGYSFPVYGAIVHTDVYYIIRNKFQLTRSSLRTACEFLLGKSNKTELDYNTWIRAATGHRESIEYVMRHCKQDVIDLQRLYERVIDFKRRSDNSI